VGIQEPRVNTDVVKQMPGELLECLARILDPEKGNPCMEGSAWSLKDQGTRLQTTQWLLLAVGIKT
jgi:hypothetical protein